MRRKTNFDLYLEEQLKDADFAGRFKKAGETWDVAVQLAALRKDSGLSQKELARRPCTSRQAYFRGQLPDSADNNLLRRLCEAYP